MNLNPAFNKQESRLLVSLREYLAAGWALCPIPAKSKAPRKLGWNLIENAITNQGQVDLITGNVGLLHAFSDTVAIDVDDYNLAKPFLMDNGIDLDALLNDSRSVLIDSGRVNRYKLLYGHPEPIPYRRMTSQGLELRCADAKGGSVQDVLPPSIHPNGTPYRWAGNGHFADLPSLPTQLLDFWLSCDKPTNSQSITEGSRNNALTSIAGKLRYEGKGETEIAESLLVTNNDQCDPPLSISEVRSIARSVSRYEPGDGDDGIDDIGVIEEGDPLLPPGEYKVKYMRHKIYRSYHGYGPKIVVWFVVIEGDHEGSIVRMFYNIELEGSKWRALAGSRPSVELLKLFPEVRKNRISPALLRNHIILARLGPNKKGTYSVIRELLELVK